MKKIDESVQVQAHTNRGRVVPVLITWKGKNYTIARVEKMRKQKVKGRHFETMKVKVLAWKSMQLELDHQRKSWRLLGIEDEREANLSRFAI